MPETVNLLSLEFEGSSPSLPTTFMEYDLLTQLFFNKELERKKEFETRYDRIRAIKIYDDLKANGLNDEDIHSACIELEKLLNLKN